MNHGDLRFQFGTKAETLERLRPLLTLLYIPELFYFSVYDWNKDKEKIMEEIGAVFGETHVIVRSSAFSEDRENIAMAGSHL